MLSQGLVLDIQLFTRSEQGAVPRVQIRMISRQLSPVVPSAQNPGVLGSLPLPFHPPAAYGEETMLPGGTGFSEANLQEAMPSLLVPWLAHCCHGDQTPYEFCILSGVQLLNTLV